MTISVIIPVFNAEDRLVSLLENLFSQNGADQIEFIFIDDHSSESSDRALYMHGMQYICGCLFRRKFVLKHHIRFISGLEPNEDLFLGVLAGYYTKKIKSSKRHGREISTRKF